MFPCLGDWDWLFVTGPTELSPFHLKTGKKNIFRDVLILENQTMAKVQKPNSYIPIITGEE